MGSPNSNGGICNLSILFLCYAIFTTTVIFPGAHSDSFHGEIEGKKSELTEDMEFGDSCENNKECKVYEDTVGCIEVNETDKICDCIWNIEEHPQKYVLNDNRTRCVGLVSSPCSMSVENKVNITCIEKAECKGGICDCVTGFSTDENNKCLLNFHERCNKDRDECLSFNENVSCQIVEGTTRCDCSLNDEGTYNYTLQNGTCVGFVNSTCDTEDRPVGCVHNAQCTSNICICGDNYNATLLRTCLKNDDTSEIILPYNASCVPGINHVKCSSYNDTVGCVNRKVEGTPSPWKCDCKGNDNIHHSLQGNYMWDNNKCLGYLGSPCDPSKGPYCIENAECKEFDRKKLCLCSSGWTERYDRLCNGTYNPLVETTTPKLNDSNSPKSLRLLIPLLTLAAITQSIFF